MAMGRQVGVGQARRNPGHRAPGARRPPAVRARTGRSDRSFREAGLSLLEVAVAFAVVAVVLAVALPRLSSRPLHLAADTQEFVANLETARGWARSRSWRYRVRVVARDRYVIERGAYSGGAWAFPLSGAAERQVVLRADVRFAASSVGRDAVFDSRGRLVGTERTFDLMDVARGWSRRVVVRTTGMVEMQ